MKCPFCAEEIQDGALKCKHCGSMLASVEGQPAPRSVAKNLFEELVEDVTKKKDMNIIIGIACAVLAVIFMVTGMTTNTFINTLFLLSPLGAGWVLSAGYIARKNGEKPKLLIICSSQEKCLQVLALRGGRVMDFRDKIRFAKPSYSRRKIHDSETVYHQSQAQHNRAG